MIERWALSIVSVALAAALLTGCTGAGEQQPPQAAQGPPALEFPQPDFDFGTANSLYRIPISFPVRNTSDRPVSIVYVNTSCDCVLTDGGPREIAPGQEDEIAFTFDAGWRHGQYERAVTVRVDEGGIREYNLKFHGNVYAPLRWEPLVANFGNVEPGKPHTIDMTLLTLVEEDQGITGARATDDDRITFELVDVRPHEEFGFAGRAYHFRVHIPITMPVGKFLSQTAVDANSATFNMPPLSIQGEVTSDVWVDPGRFFVQLKPGETGSQRLTLESRSQHPFEVAAIQNNGDVPGTFEIEDGDVPWKKYLRGDFRAQTSSRGSLQVQIREHDTNDTRVVEIPVMLMVHATN